MRRFIYFVILMMELFLTLPSSLTDESICNVKKSMQKTVTGRESRTQIVATYRRCWLFWSCTEYRSIIAYRKTQRQVTQYYMSRVCCTGFVWNESQLQCQPITGPDEPISITTENPSLNQSLSSESSLPNNSSSRNQPHEIAPPITTKPPTSRNPPTSVTTPSNQTGGARTDNFNMMRSRVPRGAVIMISIILIFIALIVVSIMLGCVLYRRRKIRRIQRKTDNLHMEPLRDLKLLSETSSHIQHFSPPSAPSDEYAIVEKKVKAPTSTNDPLQSYENTCIGGKPLANGSNGKDTTKPIIEDVGTDKTQGETNRLTHTYMDGSICIETDEKMVIPVSISTTTENCYNEVDEIPVSKVNPVECYTEVDDMTPSSVCPEGGAQEYDYCYTKIDNSSPSPNECYAEVEDMAPSSIPRDGVIQEEYETIGDVQLTYDHLDRGSTPGDSADREKSSKESDTSGGKYSVLVQSSSVDSPESYDTFQRSLSETDQSGVDGYEPLLAVPSSGSKVAELVDVDAYDGLDRAMPKTRRKGKDLLDKLRQSTNTAAYGHLGSSFESDISEEREEGFHGNPDTEPIYSNQDVPSAVDNASTYTDMSGSRPNSVLTPSGSHREKALVETYTEMSPTHMTHVSNNYCNVDLENNYQPH